jgi:hypothetical protein
VSEANRIYLTSVLTDRDGNKFQVRMKIDDMQAVVLPSENKDEQRIRFTELVQMQTIRFGEGK